MNIAAKVAADKQQHPDDFCAVKGCLWRVYTSRGVNPCRKHGSGAAERTSTASQPAVEQTARRDGTEGLVPAVALCAPPKTASRNHDEQCQCKLCDVDWIL